MVRNVLKGVEHEIIVVDDSSTDGTFEIAEKLADRAVRKEREGQSKGLLFGMRMAGCKLIITIDADLENDPQHIPRLIDEAENYDVVVASRTNLPRISEKIASRTLGRILNVSDVFSNFRLYRKHVIEEMRISAGETFGGEFLVLAKKKGFRIGEIFYDPPPRRRNPRIGGTLKANMRIIWALIKCLVILFLR